VTPAVARRFGYMPEERGLYAKMRIADQLVYLARLHGVEAGAARERTGVWLERLGLADRARDELDKLSLGNQQRVQLAAALVHDPAVLVLDEPFSGLDPLAVDALSEALAEQAAEGRHVLFSSHQLELVERLCRSVTIVVAGRIVASGEVERLRAEHGEPTWRIAVAGAGRDWWHDVSGVRAVGVDRFALGGATDPQAVLRAALAVGPVVEFARVEPTLAEIFREVVAG
jgi:ABC-2 type transport system ATP-binding protein